MRQLRSWYYSGVWGITALLAVNTAGAFTGVTFGYSWLCLGASAMLGIPGVTAMVLLDIILK